METELKRMIRIEFNPNEKQLLGDDLLNQIGCKFCSPTCQLVSSLRTALNKLSGTTQSEAIGAIKGNRGFNNCHNYPVVEHLLKTEEDLS